MVARWGGGAMRSRNGNRPATTGDHWHISVLPGTYPSGQRCCAASLRSGRTKGATLVLARLGWHLSVRPGTYPSWQRGFASSAARSARTKGATRLAPLVLRTQAGRKEDATASLPLRGRPRRKALRSYPPGQARRKEQGPPVPTPPPSPLRTDGEVEVQWGQPNGIMHEYRYPGVGRDIGWVGCPG